MQLENQNFVSIIEKIYSDKNSQRMLNLRGEGLKRNRISIKIVSRFLLTNYLHIAKGKIVTIQWRNQTTSYPTDQINITNKTFCESGCDTGRTVLQPTLCNLNLSYKEKPEKPKLKDILYFICPVFFKQINTTKDKD